MELRAPAPCVHMLGSHQHGWAHPTVATEQVLGPRLVILGPRAAAGCLRPPGTQPVHPSTTQPQGDARARGSAPLLLGEHKALDRGEVQILLSEVPH